MASQTVPKADVATTTLSDRVNDSMKASARVYYLLEYALDSMSRSSSTENDKPAAAIWGASKALRDLDEILADLGDKVDGLKAAASDEVTHG